jgi:excisionase family DNA binding protein
MGVAFMGRPKKKLISEKPLNCKDILTVEEVAAILQLRKETILRFIASKELVASRMGRPWRIRKSDLNIFLVKNENINDSILARA